MSAKPRKQPIVMFGLGQRCCYWKKEGPYYCGEFGPGDEALLDAVDMAGNQGLRCCNPSNDGLEPDAATTARAAFASTKTTKPTAALQNHFPKRTHRKLNEITLSRPTRYFRGGDFERVVEFETSFVDLRLAATQTSESSVETVSGVADANALTSATPLVFSQFTETLNVVIDSPFDRIAPLYPQPEAVWRVPTLRLSFCDADGNDVAPGGLRERDQHFSSMGVLGQVALPVLKRAAVGTCVRGNAEETIWMAMEARRNASGPIPIVKNPASTGTDAWELGVRSEFSIVATGVTRLLFASEGMIGSGYPVNNVKIDATAVADYEAAARAFWISDVSPKLMSSFTDVKQAFAKLSGIVYYYPGV